MTKHDAKLPITGSTKKPSAAEIERQEREREERKNRFSGITMQVHDEVITVLDEKDSYDLKAFSDKLLGHSYPSTGARRGDPAILQAVKEIVRRDDVGCVKCRRQKFIRVENERKTLRTETFFTVICRRCMVYQSIKLDEMSLVSAPHHVAEIIQRELEKLKSQGWTHWTERDEDASYRSDVMRLHPGDILSLEEHYLKRHGGRYASRLGISTLQVMTPTARIALTPDPTVEAVPPGTHDYQAVEDAIVKVGSSCQVCGALNALQCRETCQCAYCLKHVPGPGFRALVKQREMRDATKHIIKHVPDVLLKADFSEMERRIANGAYGTMIVPMKPKFHFEWEPLYGSESALSSEGRDTVDALKHAYSAKVPPPIITEHPPCPRCLAAHAPGACP